MRKQRVKRNERHGAENDRQIDAGYQPTKRNDRQTVFYNPSS